jgi:hypothetical protein
MWNRDSGHANVLAEGGQSIQPAFDPEMLRVHAGRVISWGIEGEGFQASARSVGARADPGHHHMLEDDRAELEGESAAPEPPTLMPARLGGHSFQRPFQSTDPRSNFGRYAWASAGCRVDDPAACAERRHLGDARREQSDNQRERRVGRLVTHELAGRGADGQQDQVLLPRRSDPAEYGPAPAGSPARAELLGNADEPHERPRQRNPHVQRVGRQRQLRRTAGDGEKEGQQGLNDPEDDRDVTRVGFNMWPAGRSAAPPGLLQNCLNRAACLCPPLPCRRVDAASVRQVVARLDAAQERAHHGHPDIRVGNKVFATLNETKDPAAFRLTAAEARALAAEQPERYRLVSDREPIAWVSMNLEDLGADELEDLLEQAWSLRAS